MRSAHLGLIAGALLLAACGGRQRQANAESHDFDCKERSVRYVVSQHLGGSELGVHMDCAEQGPRLQRWKIDRKGTRVEDARAMTPSEFDQVWGQLAGSGWENLQDCGNGTMEDRDPIYVFELKDDQSQATFQCQSRSMPYPYNTIVDPLDVAAQRGGGQLGDDEPTEMKQYDRKDLQR